MEDNGKTGQGKPEGEIVAVRDEALGLLMSAAIVHARKFPHKSVQDIIHLARDAVRAKVSGMSSFMVMLEVIDDFVAVFDSRARDAGLP